MEPVRYAIKVCFGEDVFSFPFVDKSSNTLFEDFTAEVGQKIGISPPKIFTYEDDTSDQITVKDSDDLRWGLDQAHSLKDQQHAFPRLKITVKNPSADNSRKISRRIIRRDSKQKHAESKNENGDIHETTEDEESDWSPTREKTVAPTAKRNSFSSSSSTFFETAVAVLRKTKIPMTAGQVTKYAIESGLLKTTGKTPKNTMSAMFSETLRKKVGCPFRAFREINAYGLKEIEYDDEHLTSTNNYHKRKIEHYDDDDEDEHETKFRKFEHDDLNSDFNDEMKQNKDEPISNESKAQLEELLHLYETQKEMPETPTGKGEERMEPDAIY